MSDIRGRAGLCEEGRAANASAGRAGLSQIAAEEQPMASRTHESESLLTPAEVASMFRVDPKTVTRWAKSDKLSAIRTLGGHRRYREAEVRALLESQIPQPRHGD
jgi:excisionase family DNA binding protein